MLLRHTTAEVAERQALTVNPAKTCQPIGAMYAALGIHNCLPHSHGSQGCCSYHRSTLTRHYKEPVMAATSSFTEGSSVFGGQANLLQAIDNDLHRLQPRRDRRPHDLPLGDHRRRHPADHRQGPRRRQDPRGQARHPCQHAQLRRLPRHRLRQHGQGHGRLLRRAGRQADQDDQRHPRLGRAADMREIKRLLGVMGIEAILFPDTSDVLDAPQTGKHDFYPKGGATVEQLRSTGDSLATLALGPSASEPAAKALDTKCQGARSRCLDCRSACGPPTASSTPCASWPTCRVPDSIIDERGRLVDMITDMHQYFYGKRVALWGDPDQLVAAGRVPRRPRHAAGLHRHRHARQGASRSGSKPPWPAACRRPRSARAPAPTCSSCTSGSSRSRSTCSSATPTASTSPATRTFPSCGTAFPILDRVGHSYFPTVGYRGRHAAVGEDPRRAHGPPGPRRAGGEF